MIFVVRDKGKETTYKSIAAMLKAGYSMREIKCGLSGEPVREGTEIDFSDNFMESLAIDILIDEMGGSMTSLQIAGLMGITHGNVRTTINAAQKKLRQSKHLKEFLYS